MDEKDLALQAKEYEEGLVASSAKTVAKGHASTASFGKQEISEDPTSTANVFQPGSWLPKKQTETSTEAAVTCDTIQQKNTAIANTSRVKLKYTRIT